MSCTIDFSEGKFEKQLVNFVMYVGGGDLNNWVVGNEHNQSSYSLYYLKISNSIKAYGNQLFHIQSWIKNLTPTLIISAYQIIYDFPTILEESFQQGNFHLCYWKHPFSQPEKVSQVNALRLWVT